MDAFCFEFPQEGFQVFGLGDKERFSRNLPQGCSAVMLSPELEQIFGVDDADNVVEILLIYRNPGMPFIDDPLDHLFNCAVTIYTYDFSPRDHDLPCNPSFESKNTVDHLVFINVEEPLFFSCVDDRMDILFGYSSLSDP